MSKFSILCLNGGGVRGVIQIGALLEFSKTVGETMLHQIFTDGVYGISIGSIICTLIAFKFDINEMVEMSRNLRMDELIEPPRLDHILNIQLRMGLDNGERILAFLRSIFHKKGLDFESLSVGDASIPLYIIASDITKTKTVIFNESVRIWDAIRASISLPIIFTPHVLKGRIFMDGAILCKNILKKVPKRDRTKVLALLCVNANSDYSSTSKLMSHVIHAPSIAETTWSQKKYPQNVCLLTESSTGMIELEPDVSRLLDVGSTIYRLFVAKSSD